METFNTRIYLKASTEAYCERAFGVRRKSLNWGIARFLKGKKATNVLPSNYDVMKEFRKYISEQPDKNFAWIAEQQVSARLSEETFKDVKTAFHLARTMNKKTHKRCVPKFKSKKDKVQTFSYYKANNSVFRIESEFTLSFEGGAYGRQTVRTRESMNFLRKDGVKVYRMTITRKADKYYLSLSYEKPNQRQLKCTHPEAKIGIDLGVVINAATYDGQNFSEVSFRDKASLKQQKLAKKAGNRLAKMQVGSKRYKREVLLCEKRYARAARQRKTKLEEFTTFLVENYGEIVIDEYSFKGALGLLKGEKRDDLYQSMSYQFKLRLEQKAAQTGTLIRYVQHKKGVKTTHICSNCHSTDVYIPKKTRTLVCRHCGLQIDRDRNAAINTFAL